MKINSTNISLYNKATFSYAFKGIWGEERYSHKDIPTNAKSWDDIILHSDFYERTYYPFQDENEENIERNIKEYNKNISDEEDKYNVFCKAIIGTTLPILAENYKLFKEGKLSPKMNSVIEKIIKTIVK